MAFNNSKGVANSTQTTIYTVPANMTAVVIGMNIANLSALEELVDVQVGANYIVRQAPVGDGQSFSPLDGKIILTAGEVVYVTTTTDSGVDVFISVLEQMA